MLSKSIANSLHSQRLATPGGLLTYTALRNFTGKTESGFKFKTPKLRMRVVRPIFPPPGLNLKIPEELTAENFCKQIGGDCAEYSDKFESISEVFNLNSVSRYLSNEWVERDEGKGSAHCATQIHHEVQGTTQKGRTHIRVFIQENVSRKGTR